MRFFRYITLLCLLAPVCLNAQTPPEPLPETTALLEKGFAAEQQKQMDEAYRLFEAARQFAAEHSDKAGQARALACEGDTQRSRQPAKAQTLYEQARVLYKALGDTAREAACYLNLGTCAARLDHNEEAIKQYEEAYRLYGEVKETGYQALTRQYEGDLYYDIGPMEKAAACLDQAVALFREAKSPKYLARALMLDARAWNSSGQPLKALPLYQEALTLVEEQKNAHLQALALQGISQCYLDQRDTVNGFKYMEQGLAVARANHEPNTEAMLLHNLAAAYYNQGDYRKSLNAFKEVLPYFQKEKETGSEADCLSNLGLISFRVGDFLAGLEYLNQAIALYRDGTNKSGLANTLDHLAAGYDYLGQKAAALEWEQEALKAAEASGNLRTQAEVWRHLGELYGRAGKRADERRCAEHALDLYQKTHDANGEAQVWYTLAFDQQAEGHPQEALTLLAKAQRLYETTQDPPGVADCLLGLGYIAQDAGNLTAAMDNYRKALEIFQRADSALGMENALGSMGEVAEAQGDRNAAEQFYGQALLHQEAVRASLGDLTDIKAGYQEKNFALYQRYIGLLLQTKQTDRAFEWAQKAKARALIDLMEAGSETAAPTLTPEELKQQAALARRSNDLTHRWLVSLGEVNELRGQAHPDATRREKAEKQAREVKREQQGLEKDWSAFQEQVRLHHPSSAPQHPARTVTLQETAAFLPEDTALLEYISERTGAGKATRNAFTLLVVTQKGGKPHLAVYPIKAEGNALIQKARALREACAARPDTPSERPYKALAHELYDLLVAGAAPALTGIHRLVVCPEGPLWDVPFQALLAPSPGKEKTGQSVFLWERYALVYACSATEARAALDTRQRSGRPKPSQPLLVMANPDFGTRTASAPTRTVQAAPDETNRERYLRGGALQALPYTQAEANAIRAAFPNATVKTGVDAQESLLKQTAGNYRYLHFATHAILNDTVPLLSGVALATPPKNSAEDGILTAREIFNLKLSADMIVFSACETARGTLRGGEGLVGLTWAAFAAGVPAQVVSQWSVDDAATALLMGRFYAGLKQGQSKDAALRNAALSLLHEGRYQHPFYWAPFLVLGDWR